MIKGILSIFIVFFTSFCFAQEKVVYNTSLVEIKGEIYMLHNGLHIRKDSSYYVSRKYEKVDLSNVLFKTSRSKLLPQAYVQLDTLSRLLKENQNVDILIEGHTDKVGDSRKNLRLSEKRARTIKRYLNNRGIKLERTVAIGHGDKFPICKPPCKENQRVQFSLVNNGKKSLSKQNWRYDWDNVIIN